MLSLWLFLGRMGTVASPLDVIARGRKCGDSPSSRTRHSAALIIFYGLLFIAGKGFGAANTGSWRQGFVAVIGAESAYYWIVVGDPLHRLAMLRRVQRYLPAIVCLLAFLQIAGGGTIHVWTPIDPILMFFTKQEFALLGVVTIPAMVWALRRADATLPSASRIRPRLVGLLGIVWFIFCGYRAE